MWYDDGHESQQRSSPPSLQTRQNSMWWSSSSISPVSPLSSSPSEASSLASHWMPSFSYSSGQKQNLNQFCANALNGFSSRSAYAVRAAPGALRGLLHVGVQTHHVVRSGASVTQDDLPSLLANLAVVLMVRLISIAIFHFWWWEKHLILCCNPVMSLHLVTSQPQTPVYIIDKL